MKSVLHDRYGPPEVLRLAERPDPIPKKGQIRIAVHTSSVTSGDARIRRADPFLVRIFFGLLRPRRKINVPGYEFSGVVDAVGEGVNSCKIGDAVFGAAGFRFGALAEYMILKEGGTFITLPDGWSHEQAAAIPFGATTAKYFLEDKGQIHSSDRVLIHGASGAVGVAALQVARIHGAQVDGVCGPDHLEEVQALGAERVFDYTRETPEPDSYDLIFDAAGKLNAKTAKPWLRSGGRFVSVQKGLAKDRASDYPVIRQWMEEGKLQAVIEHIYSMDEIIEAHRNVDSGHKKGTVIIRICG